MRGVKSSRYDLDAGLRESARSMAPGETRTCAEIAERCGVNRRTIEKIEAIALRKLRRRLAPIWKELNT